MIIDKHCMNMIVVVGPKGATHMTSTSLQLKRKAVVLKQRTGFSVFLSLGVSTSLFFHWIYCHSSDIFPFTKLRFVNLMLIMRQISIFTV